MATDISGQTMTALTNRYYRPRETAGPRPASRGGTQSRDNVNSAGGSRVGVLQTAIKGSRWGTDGRRVIPAKSFVDYLDVGERGKGQLWPFR